MPSSANYDAPGESKNSFSDGVTPVLTVKTDDPTIKHLLLQWSLV